MTRKPPTQRFFVGDQLTCCDGSITHVIETMRTPYYEVFLCDDGIHRYDRDHKLERGRVTGSSSWPPHPKTIAEHHPLKYPREVCEALSTTPKFTSVTVIRDGKTLYASDTLMQNICESLDKLFHYIKTGKVL